MRLNTILALFLWPPAQRPHRPLSLPPVYQCCGSYSHHRCAQIGSWKNGRPLRRCRHVGIESTLQYGRAIYNVVNYCSALPHLMTFGSLSA
ncbi:hypothetical protein M441DRAFT_349253 [Trichoderma asperellum CBS 433.97]|uniref:Uncharacterized protein n=1 Tax=Trichoderma asperellum (strain ATCC 204424 / CBS 433.97 / NBRC 101777) TaxID=1042311 RepID=A0A2T3ZI26_TRIA4|nr:hypothetical protein M441DRAFT_349253 [Trichoderma asperellum CBS 433.97]PTB44458.1 hypothetical protein M441DRAFT_349253 [Trichoderma asperellum CBS 433.97]